MSIIVKARQMLKRAVVWAACYGFMPYRSADYLMWQCDLGAL